MGRLTQFGIGNECSIPDERPCTYTTRIDVARETPQRKMTYT